MPIHAAPAASLEACASKARSRYDGLMALTPDPHRDECRERIRGVVEIGLAFACDLWRPRCTRAIVAQVKQPTAMPPAPTA
jgi:hypothetical protein